jgi:lipopolysaccharide exporter
VTARSLGRQVAIGAAFMIGGRLAMRLISVVSTLILVRLLVPEDFGIVALAAALFTVADTLTATGYAVLLVRRETADRDAYDTAFTLNLLRCLLLGALTIATASLQAALFGEPRIGPVLMVVGATVALDGLMSIGLARLQRELRFDLLFRQQLLMRGLAFAFTIGLALALGNYWCLVLGNLIAKLFAIPYSYMLAPHRPRLTLKLWREFLGFSAWMFGFNLCTAADGQAANLGLGAMGGMSDVGRQSVASQIGAAPVSEIAAPISQPLYAGLARVQDEAAKLRTNFVESLGVLATILAPLSIGIALVAPEIERIGLGAAWAGTAPLIALCALYALADSLAGSAFNAFALRDRISDWVRLHAWLVLLRAALVIAGFQVAGPIGLLCGMLLSGLAKVPVLHGAAKGR